jgi:hypothetical protein
MGPGNFRWFGPYEMHQLKWTGQSKILFLLRWPDLRMLVGDGMAMSIKYNL